MAKGEYADWIAGDGLLKIQGWARKGLSNIQIAKNIGISEQTLYKWAAKYSEFGEALKKTKEITVYEVENAMFKSALGYYVEETKITDSDKDGHKEEKIRKYIPPNVTAQIFWLKNKAPDEWQERRDIMLDTSNGVLDSILELRKDAKGDME